MASVSIPEDLAQAEKRVAELQTRHIEATVDDVIQQAITDYVQEILMEGLEGSYVTTHFADDQLTITEDATGKTITTIPAPAGGFQAAFRSQGRMLMQNLASKVQEKFRDRIIRG
ncbi:hypothetical protein [Schleiferilactobacillus perolens]|jgi:hypothetical protein|uniref:Uncharacterized protein n=1 Tax=Schleiferilactobacillus perolens DSM 12744 TaxID=1423792 RepID=A0A0R1NAN4_9LACO|nr:hypothetical protein [Schleiferilactobacillus perolens]KRL14770.1 hypothetical protein FD09_GL000430 [Schleiferilactobacillus perolens DSM 12744]MCI1892162.1 hypothetical protein [Schleiferilactobacillus harbinensis]MCI1912426.1 hypothetical protein [Schleiferilactobacillus harbinensis]MCI2171683.1 hypothetical protein [Schleiferilactobacillus perolens]